MFPCKKKPFEPRHFYEIQKRLFFLLQPSWPKGFYLNLTMSPMMTRSGIIRLFLTAQDIQVTKVHHKTQRGQVVLTRQVNTASRTEDRAGVAGGGGRQRPNGIFPSLRLVVVAGVKGRILGADGGWLPGGRSPGACGLGLVHASPPRLFTLDTLKTDLENLCRVFFFFSSSPFMSSFWASTLSNYHNRKL